jgi:hypothetical protein
VARRPRFRSVAVWATALLAAALVAQTVAAARAPKLPPGTLRGPAYQLEQYPTLSLATPAQRAAAQRLWDDMRAAAQAWQDPRRAEADGFDTTRARRRQGDTSVGFLHAEHRAFRHDGRQLDPQRPETLVYATVPGRPLVLIGVMFSMPRGAHGPTPGGPITRWHTHRVCAAGAKRGLAPLPNGACPPGSRSRQGSEMLHVWFTNDLRSGFGIHAPEPELCDAGLLPADHCGRTGLLCKPGVPPRPRPGKARSRG